MYSKKKKTNKIIVFGTQLPLISPQRSPEYEGSAQVNNPEAYSLPPSYPSSYEDQQAVNGDAGRQYEERQGDDDNEIFDYPLGDPLDPIIGGDEGNNNNGMSEKDGINLMVSTFKAIASIKIVLLVQQ